MFREPFDDIMIDPNEFQDFVAGLELKPGYKAILIQLNEGPMRSKVLSQVIKPPMKESTVVKYLKELYDQSILGRSTNENKKNPFYYIQRSWEYREYQKYLERKPIVEKNCEWDPIFNLFVYDSSTINERANRRIQDRKDTAMRDKKRNPYSHWNEKEQKRTPLEEKERQKQLESDSIKIGDSVSQQISNDGMRVELGKLVYANINEIVDSLKKGNPVSSVLQDFWKDVYGISANLESKEIENDLLTDYDKIINKCPDNEREIRIYLWISDLFHIFDMYKECLESYDIALEIARRNQVDIYSILAKTQISRGHILLHLNNLPGASEDFKRTINNEFRGIQIPPILQARSYFRLGEVEVYRGRIIDAKQSFENAIKICEHLGNTSDSDSIFIQQIKSDAYRKIGTAYRLEGDLDNCYKYYSMAEELCKDKFRGWIWLLHGWAEYYRARGYEAMKKNELGVLINTDESKDFFRKSREISDNAKEQSALIRNINRYAHALIIECEIDRIEFGIDGLTRERVNRMKERYGQALEIYLNIHSLWGEAITFISQYLAFNKTEYEIPDSIELLNDAESICDEMGFEREIALINEIKREDSLINVLNPLSLF